jgi:galactose-1-phosphate uridylyltransferase
MIGHELQRRITGLESQVSRLQPDDRARFERVFHLSVTTGQTVPPEAMHPWLATQFGSVDAVRQQRIVKVTNRITMEGSLFNELRARRPIEAPSGMEKLAETIQNSAGGSFCKPEEGTPADTFGRLRGKYSITASNVAKYDGWHSVIVFDEHHPLRFTAEQVADYVETAQEWALRAYKEDPEACYPFFLWNCLWKAGASILHGHAQATLTRGMHYARIEAWRQAAQRYQAMYGTNYFGDLVDVHRSLGLALNHGRAVVLPSLTPFKEKETLIIGYDLDHGFKAAIYLVLDTFVNALDVQSFNVALYHPPLASTSEDWTGFPFVARIVDRGSLYSKTADVAAMEMFGQSIIATDPYRLADALGETIARGQRTYRQGGSP